MFLSWWDLDFFFMTNKRKMGRPRMWEKDALGQMFFENRIKREVKSAFDKTQGED